MQAQIGIAQVTSGHRVRVQVGQQARQVLLIKGVDIRSEAPHRTRRARTKGAAGASPLLNLQCAAPQISSIFVAAALFVMKCLNLSAAECNVITNLHMRAVEEVEFRPAEVCPGPSR